MKHLLIIFSLLAFITPAHAESSKNKKVEFNYSKNAFKLNCTADWPGFAHQYCKRHGEDASCNHFRTKEKSVNVDHITIDEKKFSYFSKKISNRPSQGIIKYTILTNNKHNLLAFRYLEATEQRYLMAHFWALKKSAMIATSREPDTIPITV